MSIPTIGNPTTAADNRSSVRQSNESSSQPAGNEAPQTGQRQDEVSISSRAADLQALERSIHALPEVDQTRVEQLRAKISSGEYQVDARRLADRIADFEQSLGARDAGGNQA